MPPILPPSLSLSVSLSLPLSDSLHHSCSLHLPSITSHPIQPFKPSKNENPNLRRHIKNIHKISSTMHPRECKWDSIPDGRIKDDKDRKERIRKSKRLWARKTRLRRKAALGLCMLSQAV
ncbi:hypothetical protein F5H01DRAFT_356921 [Linnemannia elongata]|nr:hypothetical protein F5H01DRAFT_356921 [Linnemannia elongata]